jgi:hypothetical protein
VLLVVERDKETVRLSASASVECLLLFDQQGEQPLCAPANEPKRGIQTVLIPPMCMHGRRLSKSSARRYLRNEANNYSSVHLGLKAPTLATLREFASVDSAVP